MSYIAAILFYLTWPLLIIISWLVVRWLAPKIKG